MKDIIIKWMSEYLSSQFYCSNLEDLYDLDTKVQNLIESSLRKNIITLYLEVPNQENKSIYYYLQNLVRESNEENFKGVEADYNFKVILKAVTKKFGFDDLHKQTQLNN